MLRLLNLLRRAFWQGFRHGIFMNAKGAAYSSILTVFPALIVVAWFLAETGTTRTFINQISYALGVVLPPDSRATALEYFSTTRHRPVKEIYSAMSVMVLAASGVMISWMTHFRTAFGMSRNPWNFWRERAVALLLVVWGIVPMAFAMSLVAFGNQIEIWLLVHRAAPKFYVLILWGLARWVISAATSITSIMLIYHWGLPRVQPWYKALPGAVVATVLWFPVTLGFGSYVTYYASYNLIYGPLGAGIALLVWLYLISIVILVGAEFNAQMFPRSIVVDGDERLGRGRRASDKVPAETPAVR